MIDLKDNLQAVQDRIAAAAHRAGRDPTEVTLVAVSKTQPLEVIQATCDLGQRHFGENRVEEAEAKANELPESITWHMIGHIQSRKARRSATLFRVVHSVDSTRLARRLDRAAADLERSLPIMLEINVSGEASKYGFAADRWTERGQQHHALLQAVEEIVALPNLQVQGLMTMAPIVTNPEEARPVFVRLRRLREALAERFPATDWHHLSMGMTDDFEVAVEEGATIVRVGRAIFAPTLPPWCKSE